MKDKLYGLMKDHAFQRERDAAVARAERAEAREADLRDALTTIAVWFEDLPGVTRPPTIGTCRAFAKIALSDNPTACWGGVCRAPSGAPDDDGDRCDRHGEGW